MRTERPIQLIKEITENEFWVWWGLFLVAYIEGRDGNLWDKEKPEGYGHQVNMSDYMLEYRFKQIRHYIAFVFADHNKNGRR